MLESYINTWGGGPYAVAMICTNMLNLFPGQESRVGVQVLLSSDSTMTLSVCTQVFTCVHCMYCTQVGTALHHLFYTFTQTNKLWYNSQGRGHYSLLLLGLSLYGDGGNCFMVAWQHPMGAHLCRRWIELGVKGHTTFFATAIICALCDCLISPIRFPQSTYTNSREISSWSRFGLGTKPVHSAIVKTVQFVRQFNCRKCNLTWRYVSARDKFDQAFSSTIGMAWNKAKCGQHFGELLAESRIGALLCTATYVSVEVTVDGQ